MITTILKILSINYYECPICLTKFENKKLATLFCGHVFCVYCLKNISSKCPICRETLSKYLKLNTQFCLKCWIYNRKKNSCFCTNCGEIYCFNCFKTSINYENNHIIKCKNCLKSSKLNRIYL